MRRPVSRLAYTLGVTAALASTPACNGCKNDHPFVPFHIEAGVPGASSKPPVDAAPETSPQDIGPFAREVGVVAPAHATSWALGKLALMAPAGSTFRLGLTWDIDGDGHDDALVLVEEAMEGGARLREELFFYRGAASQAPGDIQPPGVRVSLGVKMRPGEESLPLDPRCTRIERLARVGKRSAAVEVGETCPKDVAEQGPDRVVALVAFSDSLRTRFALPIIDPPGGQTLAVELDGTDVDGDGLDDATLRVSLEGGEPPFEPGPLVRAVFRWFDRPAGMSREPGEPEKSFHAIAAQANQASSRAQAKDAPSAIALAAAGRFLFQAICAESPVRRVAAPPATSPLACEAGHALEELGLAAAHAYTKQGDVLRAIAALDGAELPPATRTPARVTEATAAITALAPAVQAVDLRAISAVPRLGADSASWGALRFEPSGQLLVRTLAGVVRVDPVHGDEADAAGVLAWPIKVTSPDGKLRLEGAFATPCGGLYRGAALEATLLGAEGTPAATDATSIALPIIAPLSPRCTTAREPISVLPIAWGPGGLELVAAGEPVLLSAGTAGAWKASPLLQLVGQPVIPGSPRSPDGATLVVPTSLGIFVRGAKTRIFRAKELEHGYGELRDCTVSDDAARVACVRGGVAFVGVWPSP